jgi:hypothetical protein
MCIQPQVTADKIEEIKRNSHRNIPSYTKVLTLTVIYLADHSDRAA